MRTLRLALAQTNPTVGDLEGNTRLVLDMIEAALAHGADIVAFPELALPGYPPEDLLLKPSFIRDNRVALGRVVAAARDIVVVVGFVDSQRNEVYNAAGVAWDSRLVGTYHKLLLPNYGVFDEDRYFKPGVRCPVFTVNGVGVGVNICEDIWYALGPVPVQREAGAEVIVNINGSPYHQGKGRFRERMLETRATDNGVYVAYVNTVGGQDELVFDGGSMVINHLGEPVARAAQFEPDLLVTDLDADSVFRHRLRDPRARKQTAEALRAIGEPERVFISGYRPRERSPLASQFIEPLDPVGEVYRALTLGTRDYVRKNGFEKVLVGLSGGADSSLTCCVAADALGAENVVGVAQPSRYSSEGSLSDARALADNLGVALWTMPIEPAHLAMEAVLATGGANRGLRHTIVENPFVGRRYVTMTRNGVPLGGMGPLGSDAVCYQKVRELRCVDPLTGEILWVRNDVTPGADLLGDDRRVVVAPADGKRCITYRISDGQPIGAEDPEAQMSVPLDAGGT